MALTLAGRDHHLSDEHEGSVAASARSVLERCERPRPADPHQWVRFEIIAAVLLTGAAAVLESAIDAATISARLHGEVVPGRPGWLFGFVAGALTVAMGTVVWITWRSERRSWITAGCLIVVLANLGAAAAEVAMMGGVWVLPMLHVLAASLLVTIAVGSPRRRRAIRPVRTQHVLQQGPVLRRDRSTR